MDELDPEKSRVLRVCIYESEWRRGRRFSSAFGKPKASVKPND